MFIHIGNFNNGNMIRVLLLVASFLFTNIISGQDKPAYQLFTKDGKKVKYTKMLKDFQNADVVLFGELHDNPICHWLELEVTKDIFDVKKEETVLGAEMYESDNQLILDEYLSGLIKKKHFKAEAKIWTNNKDYQPLVDFAKDNKLKFVATNVPRRYANLVARKGLNELDNLNEIQKSFITSLPVKVDLELPAYKMFLDMGMGHGSEMTPEKMAQAQAIKDATMAHFILKNWKQGNTFLHFNGSYHSDNFESICWYLKQAKQGLNIKTISTVEQDKIDELDEENMSVADFILVVPSSMTKTY